MRAVAIFAISAIAAALLAVVGVSAALAHQSPPGCDANSLDLTLTKDRTFVRNGETSTYTVQIANDAGNACDVTDATVSLTLPGQDGSPTGPTVTLASGANYPAGTGKRVIGTVPWTVNLNPGVSDAIAQGNANGKLHDAPTDHDARITKTLGTSVTQPHATLDCSAAPTSGDTPLSVTYTCNVKNDSSTTAPLSNVNVSNDKCSNQTRTGGDSNNNNTLDNGETWTYTCTTTVNDSGTTTSHLTATATNTVDNQPVTITPVETSVIASTPSQPGVQGSPESPGSPGAPSTPGEPGQPSTPGQPSNPSQPSSGVLGKRLVSPRSRGARGDARCVSTPKTLRVRARERTIVRVRIAQRGTPAATALVRIIGPGFVKRKVTNKNGVAVFRIRAKRAGRLVIQSDRCLGADRVAVLRARRVSNNHTPEGTG